VERSLSAEAFAHDLDVIIEGLRVVEQLPARLDPPATPDR
jgi:hypothetical protein